jgi:hypothetical protein
MTELYKINNDIMNIKKEIIKTIKKEDAIRFRLFKDALNKNSFPYYKCKYESLTIDDIDNDEMIKSITKYMNIENDNYYNIVKSYLELFNIDYNEIFQIKQEKIKLERRYDELIILKEDLEIKLDNYKAKKELIKNMIIIILIYLIITLIYLYNGN